VLNYSGVHTPLHSCTDMQDTCDSDKSYKGMRDVPQVGSLTSDGTTWQLLCRLLRRMTLSKVFLAIKISLFLTNVKRKLRLAPVLHVTMNFAVLTRGAACTKPPSILQSFEYKAQAFYNGPCISRVLQKARFAVC
jgi:hypothetical protein